MPKLHLEEYTRALQGKTVAIACREGILRDCFNEIIADVKFLNRRGLITRLFHNMSNRFANQQHFRTLRARLTGTHIERISPAVDFYDAVLNDPHPVFKLVFLERKPLVDPNGDLINALTTRDARSAFTTYGDRIGNANFRGVLERICQYIEQQRYDRVHILQAGKNCIKHELFTVEGAGTLIANNFIETFSPVSSEAEINVIASILHLYRRDRYLKPRNAEYIRRHRDQFYVTRIDRIIVGCVERIAIDAETVELGALAIASKFRNQRVGAFTVSAFTRAMAAEGFRRVIVLTNNPRLQGLLGAEGFEASNCPKYHNRQSQSPKVAMFVKKIQ